MRYSQIVDILRRETDKKYLGAVYSNLSSVEKAGKVDEFIKFFIEQSVNNHPYDILTEFVNNYA